jgi:membrane-bound lytic murein transglycosylase D
VQLRLAPAAFLASLSLAAGCTQLPTVPEPPPPEPVSGPPAVTQVPVQRAPHLVEPAPIVASDEEVPEVVTYEDVFARIRAGYLIEDVDHPWITREAAWYARHPEYLDRTFRRGGRYLYYIVEQIQARGMPLELALLPVVESAFNPVALSRARASGLWQFIPATGRRYGLKQNVYYDGRRDVVEATRAALDYLQFLANDFDGNWLHAVAAYNTGENNVRRAIARNRKAGKPTDFFSLQLPRETRAYVPKLLAMRRLVGDPSAYGLAFSTIANEPYFAAVDSGGQIDLQVAADLAGVARDEFLALNAGFLRGVTDPDGPHRLLVPVDLAPDLELRIADLPASERIRVAYYRVRPGDTLGAIARRHGVTVGEIQASNRLRGTLIHPNQDLVINLSAGAFPAPAPVRSAPVARVDGSPSQHVVRNGETLWSISRRYGISVSGLAAHNSMAPNETLSVGRRLLIPGTATARIASTQPVDGSRQQVTYTVRRGDTLSRISRMFQVTIKDLLAWNNIASAHRIKPGQRLVMYVDDSSRVGG